jgi:hypothetical protein
MLNCQQFAEQITDALEQRLSTLASASFYLHAKICPNCRRYLEQMRETIAALGTLREPSPAGNAGRAVALERFRALRKK